MLKNKRKKGFTIVELLGVFILLGIIAVLITPSILNLQKDADKDAFEQSVNALIRAAQVYHANNDFIKFPENGISPTDPQLELKNDDEFRSGVVKLINDEYFYAYNISNGKYCANGVRNDLSIDEGECPETASRCFEFDEDTGTIIDFYDEKVGCDIPNPIIPEEINGTTVEHIGDLAFTKGYLICEKDGEIAHDDPSIDYEWYEEYVIFDKPSEMEKAKKEVEEKFNAKYGDKNFTYEDTYCYMSSSTPIGYQTYDSVCDHCGQRYYEVYLKWGDSHNKTYFPNRLTGITLPKTIKTIGESAFEFNDISYANLEELTDLEYIGPYAFNNNNLKSVDLSNKTKLKSIEWAAFNYNEINSVNLAGVEELKTIGSNAFAYNKLKTISIKDLPNLESINYGAFANNQITSLDIDNLPKIKQFQGFENNSISSFDFSKFPTLEYLGGFNQNKFSYVSIANLPNLKTIYGSAFNKNTTLTTLDIRNLPNLETIGYNAFNECSITEVDFINMPKLKAIGDYAFFGNKITSLKFTNSYALEWTGIYSFSKNLIQSFDFSIFPLLYDIGGHTMSHNYNTLKEITIDNPKLEYIGNFAFDYNYQLKTVHMGENPSLTWLGTGVFKWSPVEHIVVPKNVTKIEDTTYYRTNSKALSVTILGDNPTRFNSRWNAIGMTGGASNCPTIPTDGSTNKVTCS